MELIPLDLNIAIIRNDIQFVKTYIKEKINCTNSVGKTILILACVNHNTEIIKELLGHKDINKIINVIDIEGYTALHHLCFIRDSIERVKLLLQCPSIDINIVSKCGWNVNALMISVYYNNIEIAKELLARPEVDIYAVSKMNNDVLNIAKEMKRHTIVEMIKNCMINDFQFLGTLLSRDILGLIVNEYL